DRIPIIMALAPDPVGSGFVTSLARPGGNVTGISALAPELAGKRASSSRCSAAQPRGRSRRARRSRIGCSGSHPQSARKSLNATARSCAPCTEIDRAIRGVTPALSACRRPWHRRLSESEKPTVSPQRSPETHKQLSRLFRRCDLFGRRSFVGFGLLTMFVRSVQEPSDEAGAVLLRDLRILGLLLIV